MAEIQGLYSVCIQENWYYCRSCHVDRLRLYDGRTANQLLIYLNISTENEIAAVNNTFTEVLMQVCISKAFRSRIYETTRYVNTARYFKMIHNYSQKSATESAKKINRNSIVYDRFEAILSNLSACPPLVDIKDCQQISYIWQLIVNCVMISMICLDWLKITLCTNQSTRARRITMGSVRLRQ